MKTEEDFRNSIGQADECFTQRIRQTLTELNVEEDKPVKKKISLSLVIAMGVMLLTVTALAASQWGVLDFAERQGTNLTETELLTLSPRYGTENSDLLDISIQEAAYRDGKLYAAVICKPKRESTLVIPQPKEIACHNISAMTMNSAMNTTAYEDGLTVMDYAKGHGFQRVVTMEFSNNLLEVYSNSIAGRGKYSGLEVTELDHLEDGTLRMLIQGSYQPSADLMYPESVEYININTFNLEYLVDGDGEASWAEQEYTGFMTSFQLYASDKTRTSIPEDAHDIVGFRGAIEYVSVTPYDNGLATISLLIDLTDLKKDDERMSHFPALQVLDEKGNVLCETSLSGTKPIFQGREVKQSAELHLATIPVEFAPAGDTFTLRIQNPDNAARVYDQYTYTMK